MSRRRREVAVAAVLTAFLALALAWVLLGRADRGSEKRGSAPARTGHPDDEASLERAARDPKREETAGGERAGASTHPEWGASDVVDAWLSFRSSSGLSLASVELEVEERSWQRRPLEEGRCRIDERRLPLRARAPGHLPELASRAGVEVVLEPDALLTIESEGLRTCLRTIDPVGWQIDEDSAPDVRDYYRTQIAEHLTYGFLDTDRWALAVSPRELSSFLGGEQEIMVILEWRDRRRGNINFRPSPGIRAVWQPPCEELRSLTPLDVVLVRPPSAPRGKVDVMLCSDGDHWYSTNVSHEPWGDVHLRDPRAWDVHLRLPSDRDGIRVEDLPVGQRCLLAASDRASGASARMSFAHDGSGRTLTLVESVVLRGRVDVPEGFQRPKRARFTWEEVGLDGQSGPRLNGRVADLDEVGGFELRGWMTNFPGNPELWQPAPAAVALQVDAIGFREAATTVPLDPSGSGDAGILKLSPEIAPIRLRPDHGLDLAHLRWSGLRISSAPEMRWEIRGWHEGNDGGLDLCLTTAGIDEEGRALTRFTQAHDGKDGALLFPPGPFDWVIIDHPGSEGFAFRRGAEDRFEPVHEQGYEVEVDCRAMPSEDWVWTLRWIWRGLRRNVEWFRADAVGERRILRFTAPEEEVELEWLASKARNSAETTKTLGSGSIPLGTARVRLELP